MADLNCYITTFNCGRTPVNVDYFAANLFNGLKTNLPPDLVALSLQEVAPLGYSFIGGSLLTPYLTRFTTAVNVAASKQFEDQGGYTEVVVTNLGMTALLILARRGTSERIRRVETAGVGVGVAEMGNKGAAAARLSLAADGEEEETVLTFVAAHLAPMEWDWERRNKDWEEICRGLVFERRAKTTGAQGEEPESEPLLASGEGEGQGGQGSLFSPVSHVFIAGDLNYRTSDTAPKSDDFTSWPQPTDTVSNIEKYDTLFKGDQLSRELKANKTLHNLAEAEINFPPTYKYSSAAQDDAVLGAAKNSTADGTQSSPWAKHRVPSWCDRILYLAAAAPQVHSYTAGPVQPTSDHRPVSLSFSVPAKPLQLTEADVKSPFPVRADWKEARAAARRNEVIVGVAAYLALTWEGEALLAGSVVGVLGGYLALRAMLGT